jgi:hypothetical protein
MALLFTANKITQKEPLRASVVFVEEQYDLGLAPFA